MFVIFSEITIYVNMYTYLCMNHVQSSNSSARWLSSSPWTSLSRTLVHVYSAASHLHSSLHVMMCALHEYLTLHLLTAQLHFTRSATASGAGDTSETVRMYILSSSLYHPNPIEYTEWWHPMYETLSLLPVSVAWACAILPASPSQQ